MTETQQTRSGIVRPLLLAVLGAAVLAGAVLYALHTGEQTPASAPTRPPAAATSAAAPAPAKPAPAVAAKPAAPSFDIVRINKAGDAVMAGRAAPGAKVTISAGGKAVGTATADPSGQWVFLPSTPLGAGGHQLTLSEALPSGPKISGKGSVLLVVPRAGVTVAGAAGPQPAGQGAEMGEESPVAVLTTPNGPLVMQGAAPVEMGGLGIFAIEYGAAGRLHITGLAPAGARLRLLLDKHGIGRFSADARGQWAMVSGSGVAAGAHMLALQRLGPDGAVIAEVTRDFSISAPGTPLSTASGVPAAGQNASPLAAGQSAPPMANGQEGAPPPANGHDVPPLAAGQIVVQRGQSLWIIARRVYGEGLRYTIIFRANHAKIRNPDLIYPGQKFTLPADTLPGATPSSSSKSR